MMGNAPVELSTSYRVVSLLIGLDKTDGRTGHRSNISTVATTWKRDRHRLVCVSPFSREREHEHDSSQRPFLGWTMRTATIESSQRTFPSEYGEGLELFFSRQCEHHEVRLRS
jgi:hypothetical protein